MISENCEHDTLHLSAAAMSSPLIKPELPPRTPPVESLSALYISRQKELYSTPYMNETGEWFCQDLNRSHEISAELERIAEQETSQSDSYWTKLISLWSPESVLSTLEVEDLESHIARGIPTALRLLVYLKVLQIRQKLSHKKSLESLVAHAKSDSSAPHLFIDSVDVDTEMKQVLTVVHLQMNTPEYRNIHPRNSRLDSQSSLKTDGDAMDPIPPNSLVMHTAKLVSLLPGISSEDRFYIMLKLNKIFDTLDMDALCYQINRTIEDTLPQYLKHLTAQGLDLSALYTKILYTFCSGFINDEAALATLLDYVVFEGLEFFLRLIVNALIHKKTEISELSGSKFIEFITLSQLFENSIVWEDILNVQPHVIKYENEFHLIHVNSFNKNDNELRNLKEIYHELNISAYEHEQQLDTLLQSHNEIAQQSGDLSKKLHEALEKQRELAREKEELRVQYDILSMKENVINTTKANEVFALRNEELQQLILAAKERVAVKKAKVERLAVPATP